MMDIYKPKATFLGFLIFHEFIALECVCVCVHVYANTHLCTITYIYWYKSHLYDPMTV